MGLAPVAIAQHEEVLLRQHDAGVLTLVDRASGPPVQGLEALRRWRMRWGKGSSAVRAALALNPLRENPDAPDEITKYAWFISVESRTPWHVRNPSPLVALGMRDLNLADHTGAPLAITVDLDEDNAPLVVGRAIVSPRRFAPLALACCVSGEARKLPGRFREMTLGTAGVAIVDAGTRGELNESLPETHRIPERGMRLFLPHGWGPVDDSECVIEGPAIVRPGAWSALADVAQRWCGWLDLETSDRSLEDFWAGILDDSWGDERIATAHGGEMPGAVRWFLPDDNSHSDVLRKRMKSAEKAAEKHRQELARVQENAHDTRRLADLVVAENERLRGSRRRLVTAVLRYRGESADLRTALRRTSVGEALRQAEEARAERDLYAEELQTVEELNHDLRRQVRWLTARLTEQGTVVAVPEEQPRFADFAALLKAARDEFGTLVIGDQVFETAAVLDGNQRTALWLRRTWSALAALHAYATEKAFSSRVRDLKSYVEDRGANLGLTPSLIAHGETEIVSNTDRFRAARTFPVPAELSSDGWAYFPAHVRIDRAGGVAPRLHFLDDVGGVTGLIHVGYLGPHLPSPGTN